MDNFYDFNEDVSALSNVTFRQSSIMQQATDVGVVNITSTSTAATQSLTSPATAVNTVSDASYDFEL
jgi:hypothetical protein